MKDTNFHLKKVEPSRVLKLLNGVNVRKATGIDKIANIILKIAAPVIYGSLTNIFNLSIASNVFPSDWKVTKISPVFKSGNKSEAKNNRPISVLPTIARVFERLVFEQLYSYFSEISSCMRINQDSELFILKFYCYCSTRYDK